MSLSDLVNTLRVNARWRLTPTFSKSSGVEVELPCSTDTT